jgi:CheY-like chemotaxis protein
VSLFFPRAGADAVSAGNPADASAPSGNSQTVLVVEDDADVRLVTVSRLESLGYRVKVATDGPGALAVVRSEPGIRLALVDVVMPGGMDGHAVADEIEKMAPLVKLILTSGYSPRMAASGAKTDRPFLPKPNSLAQLAQLVHQVLSSR